MYKIKKKQTTNGSVALSLLFSWSLSIWEMTSYVIHRANMQIQIRKLL